ncbi:unnamed protein product [Zymoseptoria tritici ST99CH_3D1]|uniref:Protein YOP1 n=3 Tax=Zymoseptoria tritici TaxID=1047171 RepID=F9X3N7_ZYMTI|nr:uncharacterized protein MYCGRDRAFT_103256 [Zymoseptoria tritici IPO323]EGP90510.1 hypothetical protein MYCGRDRAFT_103256 [Zymoseptoria tritici IPO323]SMQ47670.1 unnamed protein product [Zymoseptoria tritici ST99CH_3D7]SMR46200.1 unnamed protein product [Zymoseptoria tritici ST99CH_1E4]SMR47451.1 unnamed protein product [Zymoseptoria tritici ST99CH_3D1]
MFGFIADILTSLISILLPVFFSYKALRTSDPAVLTPWLMYWTTFSLFLLVENQFYFILYWIPFYSWMRLFIHIYLVLPGSQGSVYLYKQYLGPFLEDHERQLDRLISNVHAKGQAAGMDAFRRAWDYIRVQFMGGEPRCPTPPQSRNVSYTTSLFNRFAMPSARDGLAAAGTSDIFNLIGNALNQHPSSSSRTEQARDLASSGTLVPPDLAPAERATFVDTQRERLRTLLQAYESEALGSHVDTPPGGLSPRVGTPRQPSSRKPVPSSQDALSRSRSESEFEDLGYEPMPDPEHFLPREDVASTPKEGGAGWSNWIWGNYGERDSAAPTKKDD